MHTHPFLRRATSVASPSLSLLALALAGCDGEPAEFARATEMGSLADGIGGPKAIAQPGDIILENEHARVAILSGRNSLGPGLYGGSIVDADIQRHDPTTARGRGNDQFAEMFPTANMDVMVAEEGAVTILSDGSDGVATVRVEAEKSPFITLLEPLWDLTGAPDFVFRSDITARAGQPWFDLHTEVLYGRDVGDEPDTVVAGTSHTEGFPLINWAIESGVVLGDFYLQGGSVDVFAPGIGFDEDGAVYESQKRGENTFVDPFRFPFLAGVGDGVSYGLAPVEGDIFVPLFTASQTVAIGAADNGDGSQRFEEGTALSYDRYFFIGHGDVGSIVDQYLEARGIPFGTVSGFVTERTTGDPVSGIDVFVYEPGAEMPFSQLETDIHPDDRSDDGSFVGRLPVGTWELVAHQRGRPSQDRLSVTVSEGGTTEVALVAGRNGVLQFDVRDERGRRVPAKVTIFASDGTPVTRDPVLGDGFIGGQPESVLFTTDGRGVVELAPGSYQAVASRGIEYELDVSPVFTIRDGQSADLDLVVERSVDTSGWISADLHVHAQNSHDSGVLLADRVRTMVSEGVEFFASTDHDYLVDYAPTVEALGVEEWVQTAVGNETTTVEVGHFLGFPLAQDFLSEAGGGREEVDWTGKEPQEIIDSLRVMGDAGGHDPMVFVGHPRDGILGYFDQYGFDPTEGEPGVGGEPGEPKVSRPFLNSANELLAGANMSWDFDGLEMLNGKRFELLRTPLQSELDGFVDGERTVVDFMERTLEEQQGLEDGTYTLTEEMEGQLDDWFTLLNLGFRFTVLGNSDTHGLTSTESGCPRNFVMSDTDDPMLIDDQAVADAVKEHRVVASYGPFVQMWVNDEPIGSDIEATGSVDLTVEVQAPTWMSAERVEVYRNGSLIDVWDIEESASTVRLVHTESYEVPEDSWFAVVVTGRDPLFPVFTPVEIPYVELQAVVIEALGGVGNLGALIGEATPIPREFPIRPYAVTNPVWVDTDGGGFDAPGVPEWAARR